MKKKYTIEVMELMQWNGVSFRVYEDGNLTWQNTVTKEVLYNLAIPEPELLSVIFQPFVEKHPEAEWIIKSFIAGVEQGHSIPLGTKNYFWIDDLALSVSNSALSMDPWPGEPVKTPWFKELNDKCYLTELEKKFLTNPKKMEIVKNAKFVPDISPNIKQHLKNKKAMQKAKADHALQKKYAAGGPIKLKSNFPAANYGGEDPAVKMLPALNAKVHYPLSIRQGMNPKAAALTYPLRSVIINLNDSYKWTREQIADWIETLDIDTTFKVD